MMTHATNIVQIHASKNGKAMAAKVNGNEETYRLQA